MKTFTRMNDNRNPKKTSKILYSTITLLIFLLSFSMHSWGQTTIWSEDFDYPNNTNSITQGGASWTADGFQYPDYNGESYGGISVWNSRLDANNTRSDDPDRTTWQNI